MAKIFHGLQVYEILDNGNLLSGIYINTQNITKTIYNIDSEIARKEVADTKGVEGKYKCRYIESIPNAIIVSHCNLYIYKLDEVYKFEWNDLSGKKIFKGIGMRVSTNHIAVSYTNA